MFGIAPSLIRVNMTFNNQSVKIQVNRRLRNFLHVAEDPNVPGLFYGIDAPEFGSHAAGQLVSLTGATNLNGDQMRITYLTPRATHTYAGSVSNIPPDHTGLYRNPLKTTDGYMIAAHTAYPLYESGGGSTAFPLTSYDFRLKFLVFTNGFYTPGAPLTAGLTNRAAKSDHCGIPQWSETWQR